jgi:hypothetical protein
MKKLLLWLCLALPFIGISQTYSDTPTIFRSKLTNAIELGTIPEDISMYIIFDKSTITATTGTVNPAYSEIALDDDDGNGIWRQEIYLDITDPSTDLYFVYKIVDSDGTEYYEDTAECLFLGTDYGFTDGRARKLIPSEIPGDGQVKFCWDTCEWQCPPLPCETGLTNPSADQTCINGGQAIIYFSWETECEVQSVIYSNAEGAGPFEYQVNPDAELFGVYAGYGQMPPNWSVEHYLQVKFTDDSLSEEIVYTPEPCIEGCTDPNQESYNPWATIDDGSCSGTTCDTDTQYQITMEITFDNWPNEISWIMNSGGIIGEVPTGEYDYNDIGQTYTYNFCIDQNAGFELIVNDTYGDGLAGSTSGGSLDGEIIIYDCNGDIIWEMEDPDFGSTLYSGQQFGIQCEVTEEIYGCTDPTYQEYNPDANIDDGSCETLHIIGCMDENSINYNPDATLQEIIPTCDYNLILKDAAGDGWGNSFIGITQNDVSLGTYTMGPGSPEQVFPLTLSSSHPVKVYYFQVGGPQSTPEEVQFQTWHNSFLIEGLDGEILISEGENPFENNGQGALQNFESPFFITYEAMPYCGDVCIPIVEGCMTEGSLNYNPDANVDDGSCIPIIYGCMNEFAFNYNPEATVDDGSCEDEIVGCMDPAAFNYNPDANTPGDCIPVVEGCMNELAFNYNPSANVDDGSCVPVIYGCTDPTAFNYNVDANTDNGSCVEVIYGCTDPDSVNYNPLANTDNGSCITPIVGCTDPNSYNYDPNANVSDPDACLYDAGCITGPGEPYWLNNNCYAWVIDVDDYCCDNDWDPVCQEMYNYCENGWPDGIDINGRFNRFSGIIVYPNPSANIININSNGLDITYSVFDATGRIVIENSNKNQIDLSNVESGVYLLTVTYEGQTFNKKIIKQ